MQRFEIDRIFTLAAGAGSCLLVAAMAATPLLAQEAERAAEARAARLVGRPSPAWTDATLLAPGTAQELPAADFARQLIGEPVLIIAPRPGDAGKQEIRELAPLFPKAAGKNPTAVVRRVIAQPTAAEELPFELPSSWFAVHMPAIDAAYGGLPRPWAAVQDRRGVLRAVEPLTNPVRIRDALENAWLEPEVNPLVGERMPSLDGLQLHDAPLGADGEPDRSVLHAPDPDGLVLYRFWTEGCPHCRASLPALAALEARFDGLRLVPIYHRKSPVKRSPKWLRNYLEAHETRGAFAEDPDWELLELLLERGELRRATSVSFLVDGAGIIRWVHEGPRVHPDPEGRRGSAGPDHAFLAGIVQRWFASETEAAPAAAGERRR